MVIMLGGALGSALRYALSTGISEAVPGSRFPWGTLAVNVIGSFIIGLFVGLAQDEGVWWGSPNVKAFVVVGILGGFTTFSAFSLQTVLLLQNGHILQAIMNVVVSVTTCLLFTAAGFALASTFSLKS